MQLYLPSPLTCERNNFQYTETLNIGRFCRRSDKGTDVGEQYYGRQNVITMKEVHFINFLELFNSLSPLQILCSCRQAWAAQLTFKTKLNVHY